MGRLHGRPKPVIGVTNVCIRRFVDYCSLYIDDWLEPHQSWSGLIEGKVTSRTCICVRKQGK